MSYSTDSDSSRVRRKKSDELWSSNLEDLDVKLYPPKAPFKKTIFRPLGFFLHALENDKGLLAHPAPGMGVFLTIFEGRGVKNWLKM